MVEFPKAQWRDYALLDSGNGLKLERFGSFAMIRPEPKALWTPSMPEAEWNRLAAVRFKPGAGFGKAGKEDSGTWERLKEMPDQWFVQYPGEGFRLRMRLGLTSFKHVGIFPEQAPNWEFIYRKVREAAGGVPPEGRAIAAPRVLNLFAYTGGASLAAKSAGADVTHLDSVRQVVSWARENMEATGLQDIRWVVEDAMKFARREAKRGHLYDGIILDPPAYGHGPDGEKWKLDELLFEMLRTVRAILAPGGWMVLNLYSNGYSAALGETVVREAFGLNATDNVAATVQADNAAIQAGQYRMISGELALNDQFGKALPLSIYVRLEL
ncbi:MAG: class I SAM-dependent methyltransferase [Bacteroidales bacterium]|nr:class I SAM-dependent methyltransferase [Bacteroidales bacterium]